MNWKEQYEETLQLCRDDPEYLQYAGREKMLAFVFTFLRQLNINKDDYAPALRNSNPLFLLNASSLQDLKQAFGQYTEELLFSATNTGEVQARPVLANYYKNILWTGFVFILNYWARDHSENQEKTDVFVEKTIHFMFDMLAPNAIDSGIDLVRFLIQLRKEK
jgi:Tetracyclin repressor-like, C-terminal domain